MSVKHVACGFSAQIYIFTIKTRCRWDKIVFQMSLSINRMQYPILLRQLFASSEVYAKITLLLQLFISCSHTLYTIWILKNA